MSLLSLRRVFACSVQSISYCVSAIHYVKHPSIQPFTFAVWFSIGLTTFQKSMCIIPLVITYIILTPILVSGLCLYYDILWLCSRCIPQIMHPPRNRVRSPDSAPRVIPMATRLGPAMLCTNSSWCCRDSSLRSPVMDDFLTLVLSKGSFCSTCLWSCSLYIIVCDLIYIYIIVYIYIYLYPQTCKISWKLFNILKTSFGLQILQLL